MDNTPHQLNKSWLVMQSQLSAVTVMFHEDSIHYAYLALRNQRVAAGDVVVAVVDKAYRTGVALTVSDATAETFTHPKALKLIVQPIHTGPWNAAHQELTTILRSQLQ